jgi:hypothetical protein
LKSEPQNARLGGNVHLPAVLTIMIGNSPRNYGPGVVRLPEWKADELVSRGLATRVRRRIVAAPACETRGRPAIGKGGA